MSQFTKEQLIARAKQRSASAEDCKGLMGPLAQMDVALIEIALAVLAAPDNIPPHVLDPMSNMCDGGFDAQGIWDLCRESIMPPTPCPRCGTVSDRPDGAHYCHVGSTGPQSLTTAETEFFSYGSEHGFEYHKTAQGAIDAAEAAIDDYRGDACDGWSEEVDSICWGVIKQSSTRVGERPRTADDHVDTTIKTVCDYALLPNVQAPQPAPVVPAGYTLVPIEPTDDMIIAGFESEPDESFSKPEEWAQYVAMSGCQQAAHNARLCWSAMLRAAPEYEATK